VNSSLYLLLGTIILMLGVQQSLAACTVADLQHARALWADSGIKDYEFVFDEAAFVSLAPVRVQVRKGVAESVTWYRKDGHRWLERSVGHNVWAVISLSAEGLFARVASEMKNYSHEGDSVDCEFDPVTGLLKRMSGTAGGGVTDSDFGVTVSEFRRLDRR
jgi:hypothetical protein